MKAVVIREPGGPDVLELRDVPDPRLGAGEILVRVRATALNRADLLQRRGRYPAPPGAPADVPGLELAGDVAALGPGVREWAEGDRVMGLVGGGGYAELAVLHEREALPVPDRLSFAEAAAVPEAFITAHDALFTRAGLGSGERLLVHAVGSGVGTAALQIAKAAGATVYGTARSGWKLERAAELGLDGAIDSGREDFVAAVERLTDGEGVHVVLDLVGGGYVPGDLRALATLGRIVVVGTVAGRETPLDLGLLLRKRATLVGTVLRARPLEEKIAAARAMRAHVLPLLEDGRVRPLVDRVLGMAEAAEAHACMEENRNFGKIVLAW